MENSMDPPPAIYWTHPVTCICLCSALDKSLGPLAIESPCITMRTRMNQQAQFYTKLNKKRTMRATCPAAIVFCNFNTLRVLGGENKLCNFYVILSHPFLFKFSPFCSSPT